MCKFKKGELIEVRNSETAPWSKRVFIFKHDDFFYCEHSGVKRPLVSWKYARKIKSDLEIDYKGDCFIVSSNGDVFNSAGNNKIAIELGYYRKTRELAEISSKNAPKRNRLEELTMWIDPEWRDDGIGTEAYRLFLYKNTVFVDNCFDIRYIGQVYMSEKSAKRLSKAFNEGELKIEDYL